MSAYLARIAQSALQVLPTQAAPPAIPPAAWIGPPSAVPFAPTDADLPPRHAHPAPPADFAGTDAVRMDLLRPAPVSVPSHPDPGSPRPSAPVDLGLSAGRLFVSAWVGAAVAEPLQAPAQTPPMGGGLADVGPTQALPDAVSPAPKHPPEPVGPVSIGSVPRADGPPAHAATLSGESATMAGHPGGRQYNDAISGPPPAPAQPDTLFPSAAEVISPVSAAGLAYHDPKPGIPALVGPSAIGDSPLVGSATPAQQSGAASPPPAQPDTLPPPIAAEISLTPAAGSASQRPKAKAPVWVGPEPARSSPFFGSAGPTREGGTASASPVPAQPDSLPLPSATVVSPASAVGSAYQGSKPGVPALAEPSDLGSSLFKSATPTQQGGTAIPGPSPAFLGGCPASPAARVVGSKPPPSRVEAASPDDRQNASSGVEANPGGVPAEMARPAAGSPAGRVATLPGSPKTNAEASGADSAAPLAGTLASAQPTRFPAPPTRPLPMPSVAARPKTLPRPLELRQAAAPPAVSGIASPSHPGPVPRPEPASPMRQPVLGEPRRDRREEPSLHVGQIDVMVVNQPANPPVRRERPVGGMAATQPLPGLAGQGLAWCRFKL